MSDWNVYYNNPSCSEEEEGQALEPGKEIPINKEFLREGEQWKILSMYTFSEGLVIHLCKRIEKETIKAFYAKWASTRELILQQRVEEIPQEELDMMMDDSPFNTHATTSFSINGLTLQSEGSICEGWNPVQDPIHEEAYNDIRNFLSHYSLDEDAGWYIIHCKCRWPEKPVESIKKVQLFFEALPTTKAGPRFSVTDKEQEITFRRPVGGQGHVLKVLSYQPMIFSEEFDLNNQWEYPKHYFQLVFSVMPNLSDDVFFVTDCSRGDSPHQIGQKSDEKLHIMHVGLVALQSASEEIHSASSALYFDPPKKVQWRVVFHEKIREDFTLTLHAGKDFDII